MNFVRTVVLASLAAWLWASPALGYDYSDYTWLSYSDHEYTLTFSTGEWHEIEAEAVAVGGHLVTVNDFEENNWLYTDLGPFFGVEHGLIGFTDEVVEGEWRWIGEVTDPGQGWDGGIWQDPDNFVEPIQDSFAFWTSGEPSDSDTGHPGHEDYGEIRLAPMHQGRWNDTSGYNLNSYHGIIEIVPEPATLSLLVFGSLLVVRRRR